MRIHTSHESWITLVAIQDWKNHRIRKVDPTTGETTTLAGSTEGFNDGVGTSARFSSPMGIAIDPHGDFALVSVRACPNIPAPRTSGSQPMHAHSSPPHTHAHARIPLF